MRCTLLAAVTTNEPPKYARSQISWKARAQSFLAVPSDRLITSKPSSTAHTRPAWKAAAVPLRDGPSTRTLVIRAAGAKAWMIPAQAVPWPNTSPCGPVVATTVPSSPTPKSMAPSTSMLSSSAGWSASIPLSITATRTPAPVLPPNAHSGVISTVVASSPRRRTADSRAQAGRAVEVTDGCPTRARGRGPPPCSGGRRCRPAPPAPLPDAPATPLRARLGHSNP